MGPDIDRASLRPVLEWQVPILVRQRHSPTVLIFGLLLLQVLLPSLAGDADAQSSGRGGTNDDFLITDILIGNASYTPALWVQGDGSTLEYIFKGDSVPVQVTVKRSGSSFNPVAVSVLLEAVHPVGFTSWSANWTTADMYGGQTDVRQSVWLADTAHSILNGSDLQGGFILRATVKYSADNRNDNDVLNLTVPVAYISDIMDDTSTSGDTPTMVPFRCRYGTINQQTMNGLRVGRSDPTRDWSTGPHR